MQPGFQPSQLYELIYRARDPLVLGFAATRNLGAYLGCLGARRGRAAPSAVPRIADGAMVAADQVPRRF